MCSLVMGNIINHPVLDVEKERRHIRSQHLLLLKSLFVNQADQPACAKQSSLRISDAVTIWGYIEYIYKVGLPYFKRHQFNSTLAWC